MNKYVQRYRDFWEDVKLLNLFETPKWKYYIGLLLLLHNSGISSIFDGDKVKMLLHTTIYSIYPQLMSVRILNWMDTITRVFDWFALNT